jgi:hypothetical protein
MKKQLILILCFIICFTTQAQLSAEQKIIRKVFFDFLSFYEKNEKRFNSFDLYKGKGKDNAPPYHVQWANVEKYFTYLRSSVPYVGEAYIKAEKLHFKYSDSCFKANPEDEIAAGFDYDRWAGGQESISYTKKWYSSSKNKYIVTISGNTAVLKIGGELFKDAIEAERSWSIVPFVKEKGRWVMADNIYPFDN